MLMLLTIAAATQVTENRFAKYVRWQPVAYTSNGSEWYADRETLKIDSQRVLTVWIKMDHAKDSGTRARETKALMQLDCPGRRYFYSQGHQTFPDGKTKSMQGQYMFKEIPPETAVEGVWRSLCKEGEATQPAN